MADATQFILNSDYPFDKVVFMIEGSFNVGAHASVDTIIPHGLNFKPLALASWSPASDWEVSYEPLSGPTVAGQFVEFISVYSDASNITITGSNGTGSTATIYYRVYCFEPSNKDEDAAFTSSNSIDTIINSDINYSKLLAYGIITQGAVGSTPVTQSVSHDLGHYPQVLIWKELNVNGLVLPIVYTPASSYDVKVIVGTSTVDFVFKNSLAMQIHYRIYADE